MGRLWRTGGRLLADAEPLRASAPYRRLWIGGWMSAIGSSMTNFAVVLQTYDLTHSSAAVGALELAQAIPILVLGLFGGSVGEAVDQRRLVLATSSCLTCVSALFAVQSFLGPHRLWPLYVLTILQSSFRGMDGPARRAFPTRLLPPLQLAAASALSQMSFHLTSLAGPVLAGGVVDVLGLRGCYVIDTLSFGLALYGLARLPPMPPRDASARPGLRGIADGLGYVRRQPVIRAALLATLGPPTALFPAMNAARFGGSAQTLGLLSMSPAVGGVLGAVLSGPTGRVVRQGRGLLIAFGVLGLATVVFSLARTLLIAMPALAVAGAATTTCAVFRSAITQRAGAARLRTRILSVEYVVALGVPRLGNFEAGLVASWTSAGVSAASTGLAAIAGVGLISVTMPALLRYRAAPESDDTGEDDDPRSPVQGDIHRAHRPPDRAKGLTVLGDESHDDSRTRPAIDDQNGDS